MKSKFGIVTIVLIIALIIGGIILGSVIGYMIKPNAPSITQLAVTEFVITQMSITKIAKIYPTFTPYPTYTDFPVPIPATVLVVITTTPVPVQEIPPTSQPITSSESMTTPKTAGYYLVNVDIAPGVWKNNGTSDECYWKITSRTGEIIDNDFGMGGGTMYIDPNAFQVQMEQECGVWTYIGPP